MDFLINGYFIRVLFKDAIQFQKIKNKGTVSVIFPAYNEEKTISSVIHTLHKSDLIDEIICVNDGSLDDTSKIVTNLESELVKLKFVNLSENVGKGGAVANGAKLSSGKIILMVDADLSNFNETHLELIVSPLILNFLDINASLGLR
ncbi:MAG: glycosyltransferase family 2 protein [Candidatus Dojkabacteria bacterium]|nr:glycosyltransferase family 2 protein [Candidatus Dojkabacteria bacterium]